jgi:hypothetical protein
MFGGFASMAVIDSGIGWRLRKPQVALLCWMRQAGAAR